MVNQEKQYVASLIECDGMFLGDIRGNQPVLVASRTDAKLYWSDEFCEQEAKWLTQFCSGVAVRKYTITYHEESMKPII